MLSSGSLFLERIVDLARCYADFGRILLRPGGNVCEPCGREGCKEKAEIFRSPRGFIRLCGQAVLPSKSFFTSSRGSLHQQRLDEPVFRCIRQMSYSSGCLAFEKFLYFVQRELAHSYYFFHVTNSIVPQFNSNAYGYFSSSLVAVIFH